MDPKFERMYAELDATKAVLDVLADLPDDEHRLRVVAAVEALLGLSDMAEETLRRLRRLDAPR